MAGEVDAQSDGSVTEADDEHAQMAMYHRWGCRVRAEDQDYARWGT